MDCSRGDEDSQDEPGSPTNQVLKDPTFYRDNGDVVFLVDQTLFKIHRAYLTEPEDSAFRSMFQIPQRASNSQPDSFIDGADDEHPIRLDDTAQEFHALCSVLYAPAWKDLAGSTDIWNLAFVASMSNKYSFQSLENWSSKLLFSLCFSGTRTRNLIEVPPYAEDCSEDFLERLLELSIRLQNSDFQSQTEDQWISRLEAEEKNMKIATALNVGGRLGLRPFLGRLYYIAMIATCKASAISVADRYTRASLTYPPGLSPDQQAIVRNGLAAMTILWDSISQEYIVQNTTIKPFNQSSSEQALTKLPCADVLGRLKLILSPDSQWTIFHFRHLEILQRIYDYYSENLDIHFLGSPGNEQNP